MTVSVYNLDAIPTIPAPTPVSLDDGTICTLIGHDGWGTPPNHRLTIRGPEQHGETDYGYRLDPRIGKLLLQFPDKDLASMYTHRDQLRNLFKPQSNLQIQWTKADGTLRYFDGHLAGDITTSWDVKHWAAGQATVLFKVENGYCYDPLQKLIQWTYGGGANPFDIFSVVPSDLGGSNINQTNSFYYPGEWLSYPIVRVTGPITDFWMTHIQSGYFIKVNAGVTIPAGDTWTFDLRYSYKTVKNNAGTRENANITTDSDLAHFAILDGQIILGGGRGGGYNNSINVFGTSIAGGTEVDIYYYENYLGV